jgi:hypothetical protein
LHSCPYSNAPLTHLDPTPTQPLYDAPPSLCPFLLPAPPQTDAMPSAAAPFSCAMLPPLRASRAPSAPRTAAARQLEALP